MKRVLAPVIGGLAWMFAAGSASAANLNIVFAPAVAVPLDGWVTAAAAIGMLGIAFFAIRRRGAGRMIGLVVAAMAGTGALVYGAGKAYAIDAHITTSPAVISVTIGGTYTVINDSGVSITISATNITGGGFAITTNTCNGATLAPAGTCNIGIIGL